MPTETRFVRQKKISKEGSLVVPLDALKSLDNVTVTVVSGTSSILYSVASGKEAYITHALFVDLSGILVSQIQLKDTRGSGLCVPWLIQSGETVEWKPRPTACGPIVSGITVESPRLGGQITLLLHLDPKREE